MVLCVLSVPMSAISKYMFPTAAFLTLCMVLSASRKQCIPILRASSTDATKLKTLRNNFQRSSAVARKRQNSLRNLRERRQPPIWKNCVDNLSSWASAIWSWIRRYHAASTTIPVWFSKCSIPTRQTVARCSAVDVMIICSRFSASTLYPQSASQWEMLRLAIFLKLTTFFQNTLLPPSLCSSSLRQMLQHTPCVLRRNSEERTLPYPSISQASE